MNNVRHHIPAFQKHSEIIYFDSSSHTPMPTSVIEAMNIYHEDFPANIDRAMYDWATRASKEVLETRKKVAKFISAQSHEEIFFTSGATSSNQLLAHRLSNSILKPGDEILLCPLDHTSTVEPWMKLSKITVKHISYDPDGDYYLPDISENLSSKTKLVVLTHIHNVHGVEMEITKIRTMLPESVQLVLDLSQSVSRTRIDIQQLGADYAFFSAHKMFGDMGTGVLWVKKWRLSEINYPREPLESGSLNVSGIISLGAAVDFLEAIGSQEIVSYLTDLTQHLISNLRLIPEVEFLPGWANCNCFGGYGIVSFKMNGIGANDMALILNSKNIFVRSGSHCRDIRDDSIRVSMHIYNTYQEIDKLIQVLKDAFL